MDFKLVFKNAIRKIKQAEINAFSDLQKMCWEAFPSSQGLKDLEYFYIDEDKDEIMIVNDEDLEIMKEDFHSRGGASKSQKILMKTKIDSLMEKKPKKEVGKH